MIATTVQLNLGNSVHEFDRIAWTGGDTPTKETRVSVFYRQLRRIYFREQLRDCGGLNLWACAGTSALERARMFWKHASYDAHATLRH
jgi:hypothetical protein